MNPPSGQLPASPIPLRCHPASPWCPAWSLSASVAAAGSQDGPGLLFEFRLVGDLSALRLPDPASPGPADGLWQHTCFEAFVARPGETAYREFNFSPSGQWAAYGFSAERQRDPALPTVQATKTIEIEQTHTPGELLLQAWLPLVLVPQPEPAGPLHWGLTAVLEHTDGRLSYWALSHPANRPDFHHPDGRQLALTLPLPPSQPA